MIQRKQSVFYLIAILALAIPMLGFAVVSIAKPNFENPDLIQNITLFGNDHVKEQMEMANISPMTSYPLYILALVVILLLLICIFSYKNLKRQASLGRLALWAILIVSIIYLIVIFNAMSYANIIIAGVKLGMVLHFTVTAAFFVLLGNRGVKKDQKLLASVDRIR